VIKEVMAEVGKGWDVELIVNDLVSGIDGGECFKRINVVGVNK
jgi:hypothetical protein